jgi:hypothetical protein
LKYETADTESVFSNATIDVVAPDMGVLVDNDYIFSALLQQDIRRNKPTNSSAQNEHVSSITHRAAVIRLGDVKHALPFAKNERSVRLSKPKKQDRELIAVQTGHANCGGCIVLDHRSATTTRATAPDDWRDDDVIANSLPTDV